MILKVRYCRKTGKKIGEELVDDGQKHDMKKRQDVLLNFIVNEIKKKIINEKEEVA